MKNTALLVQMLYEEGRVAFFKDDYIITVELRSDGDYDVSMFSLTYEDSLVDGGICEGTALDAITWMD
jgi:hypothetical protein